jgi:IclR family transcriptional regulator, acetate operon repressor
MNTMNDTRKVRRAAQRTGADLPQSDGVRLDASSGPDSAAAPETQVGSVDRALRLLLLLRRRPVLSLSEAASDLGVASSTAHRLLAILARHGYADHERGSPDYVAGRAFAELCSDWSPERDLLARAGPILQALTADLGETTNIAVLRGREVLFLGGVQSEHLVRVDDRAGRLVPAFRSACGKVLLAFSEGIDVADRFPEAVLVDDSGWHTSRSSLELELDVIRRSGWSSNESSESVVSIAVPVRRGGSVIAALGAIAPRARRDQGWVPTTLAALLAAAAEFEDP